MAISEDLLHQSIDLIAGISQLEMDPVALAQDVALLELFYEDELSFKQAITSICRSITQLASGMVTGTVLKQSHTDWYSYHFQYSRSQGQRADLRVIYQMHAGAIRVKGFGHRFVPSDIYERLGIIKT